jgi:FtsP/CotA-like multicopper oxidase with cupredoxin domain
VRVRALADFGRGSAPAIEEVFAAMNETTCNRRRFIGLAAGGAALTAFDAWGAASISSSGKSLSPEPSAAFDPDVELELTAAQSTAQLLPGAPTRLWQFTGKVLKGDPQALTTLPGSSLPVIRVRQRQRLRIFFRNELPEESIVHWHGLHIVQKMDGHPMYAIAPGQRYVYEFVVANRAGMYWFHPHPHGRTGGQVYRGLVGLFIVEDDDAQLGLPTGEFELAWVLQDRRFDAANQLVYANNRMDLMMGVTGDRILVNGRPDHVERVAATAYRVRLLNASNSRLYKLAWGDGRPLTVIGADGGLLERPIDKPYVMLAPAERVELWLDLSREKPGAERVLRSMPFSGGMMGMMGSGMGPGMRGSGALANGAAFDVLSVRVDRVAAAARALPSRLSSIPWPRIEEAANRNAPRVIRLEMGRGRVALNGRTFDMTAVAHDEIVKLGTTEVWEFSNAGPMSHPMHVHNLQFRVIERLPGRGLASVYDTMRAGLVDEGWKDVVIVMPGERVRVLMRFTDHAGLYLYHCHILEHEDLGMMRNYRVQP